MAKSKRFEEIYSQSGITRTKIIVDTETGVHYIYHSEGYSGGLTVLLDEEGKPFIKKPDAEEK